jgi:hypothetical protein
LGTLRVFDHLNYTVYYSEDDDVYPPTIWQTSTVVNGSSQTITVDITDSSGVARLAVGYTDGKGDWTVVDFTQDTLNPNLWTGTIPFSNDISYFIEALDTVGNVVQDANKAQYYPDRPIKVFLPMINR